MNKSMNGVEHNLKRLSLRSPFNNPNASKKPRHVSEYSIELDDPYKKFAPGDRIIGQVLLKVERPVRITHLTICLHGVVKVLKNGRIPAESTSRWRSYLATGQGKCGVAYFGNGLAALFKDEVILAGDGCLAMGLYQFNFDLNLPENDLPSSIDVSPTLSKSPPGLTINTVPAWFYILYAVIDIDQADHTLANLQMRAHHHREGNDRRGPLATTIFPDYTTRIRSEKVTPG